MTHAPDLDIYLDSNATSVVLPAAVQAAVQAMTHSYGNPSSTHGTGLVARDLLDGARQRAMRVLGVGGGRLMFNSGATEGIQTAVLSALCALRERRDGGAAIGSLLLYGATEHKAVPESLAHWNRLLGLNLTLRPLPVDAGGRHDLAALRALAPELAFLCTMAANNETGVVSDLDGIAAVLDEHACQALWMVDCVQALGKLALNLAATRIDYAPFSGHKLHAPKGVGMLYVRAGTPFTPLVMGGGQESGLRSGTENMAGIAALDAVLAALEQGDVFRSPAELGGFRDRLAASLRAALPGLQFNTPLDHALPTTLNFSVPGVSSRELTDVFDAAGVRVSSGSACSAAKATPSAVLDAMGLAPWRSSNAVRLSFGPAVDAATIDAACARIARCGAALAASGLLAAGRPAPAAGPLQDGVLQLGSGAACSWLVLDAASRGCIVIDPQPALAERIEATVRRHGYRVMAILGTAPGADLHTLRAALRVPDVQDAFGWVGWYKLTLEDGQAYSSLALGTQTLVRIPCGNDQVSYLLGHPSTRRLPAAAVRYAFTGAAEAQQLAPLIDADTVLCAARDEHKPFCSSLRAEAREMGKVADSGGIDLDAPALAALMQAHPDARLIDVRESYEHVAGARTGPGGRPAHSVPLSRLASEIAGWLRGAPVPLIFFCRSGNRSGKAAQCLRRLGYGPAYHLAGGIARR